MMKNECKMMKNECKMMKNECKMRNHHFIIILKNVILLYFATKKQKMSFHVILPYHFAIYFAVILLLFHKNRTKYVILQF